MRTKNGQGVAWFELAAFGVAVASRGVAPPSRRSRRSARPFPVGIESADRTFELLTIVAGLALLHLLETIGGC